MAVRNRTAAFTKCRAASIGVVSTEPRLQPLDSSHADTIVVIHAVTTDLNRIGTLLTRLQELHAKRVRVKFADDVDVSIDGEIAEVNEATQTRFKVCTERVQALRRVPNMFARNAARAKAAALNAYVGQFSSLQRDFASRLRAAKQHESESVFTTLLRGEDAAMVADADIGFTHAQLDDTAAMAAMAEERDTEIRAIVKSVNDIKTLMEQLRDLVVEQGELLDRIDYNVGMTVERVEHGNQQLKSAQTYQRGKGPLRCIAALALCIVVMLVVLLVRKL